MIDKVAIVGTGYVGANLAIVLAKLKIKELYLYDDASINHVYHPFLDIHFGLNKLDVVKNYVNFYSDKSTKVKTFNLKIYDSDEIDSSFLIVDCRDTKNIVFHSDVSISLDRHILLIDGNPLIRKDQTTHYIFKKEDIYLNTALEIMRQYFRYYSADNPDKSFKFYDLSNLRGTYGCSIASNEQK